MQSVDLIEEMTAVVRKLNSAKIPYALCGGLAVAFHGHVRATQDIDFLVRPEHISSLMETLGSIGYTLEGGVIPVGYGEIHPCEIHRVSKAVGNQLVTLDLIATNPSLEPAWNERQQREWRGETISVVSRDGLAVMKRLSRRPIDLADLQALGIPIDEA
jgi:hypothetical protein